MEAGKGGVRRVCGGGEGLWNRLGCGCLDGGFRDGWDGIRVLLREVMNGCELIDFALNIPP